MELDDILKNANQRLFIDQHRKLTNKIPAGLVLIVSGGNIKLYNDGLVVEEIVEFRPQIFHKLKEISHLYMSLYFMGQNIEMRKELASVLESLLSRISQLEQFMKHSRLSEKESHDLCVDISSFLSLLKSYVETNDKDFKSLNEKAQPYLDRFITVSAEVAEVSLHEYIQSIKPKWNEKWNQISVIVMGRSVHRIGDITMQYFGRLTGKEHEQLSGYFSTGWKPDPLDAERKVERKLIYGENITDDNTALNLLSEHNVAEKMGTDIFGKDKRMLYDLLAEKANVWLHKQCDH